MMWDNERIGLWVSEESEIVCERVVVTQHTANRIAMRIRDDYETENARLRGLLPDAEVVEALIWMAQIADVRMSGSLDGKTNEEIAWEEEGKRLREWLGKLESEAAGE